jgi:hypothetical protein
LLVRQLPEDFVRDALAACAGCEHFIHQDLVRQRTVQIAVRECLRFLRRTRLPLLKRADGELESFRSPTKQSHNDQTQIFRKFRTNSEWRRHL